MAPYFKDGNIHNTGTYVTGRTPSPNTFMGWDTTCDDSSINASDLRSDVQERRITRKLAKKEIKEKARQKKMKSLSQISSITIKSSDIPFNSRGEKIFRSYKIEYTENKKDDLKISDFNVDFSNLKFDFGKGDFKKIEKQMVDIFKSKDDSREEQYYNYSESMDGDLFY